MKRSRKSAAAQGYDRRWQKARKAFLAANPLCVQCRIAGRFVSATQLDHIKPHCGDMNLFWDKSNWQALCATHHAGKTAREDGGFGNTPASAKTDQRKKYARFGNVWLGDSAEGAGQISGSC